MNFLERMALSWALRGIRKNPGHVARIAIVRSVLKEEMLRSFTEDNEDTIDAFLLEQFTKKE